MLSQAEGYRPIQFLRSQTDRDFAGILPNGKLIGSVVGTQRVSSLDILLKLRSEAAEYLRQRAGRACRYPVEGRSFILFVSRGVLRFVLKSILCCIRRFDLLAAVVVHVRLSVPGIGF
jgi:hypothetical protein